MMAKPSPCAVAAGWGRSSRHVPYASAMKTFSVLHGLSLTAMAMLLAACGSPSSRVVPEEGPATSPPESADATPGAPVDGGPDRPPSDGGVGSAGGGTADSGPTAPPSSNAVVDIAIGPSHGCALYRNGDVACWGDNTMIGSSASGQTPTPVRVSTIPPGFLASALRAGATGTCALGATGAVCWGPLPSPELASLAAKDVSFSFGHACAVMSTNTVRCWGINSFGQLGDGTTEPRPAVDVPGIAPGADSVSVAQSASCAAAIDGRVLCWGQGYGPTPRDEGIRGAIRVARGRGHVCALTGAGAVACAGANAFGQSGSLDSPPNPTRTVLTGVAQIVAGLDHTCALMAAGDVKCWGDNSYGQVSTNVTKTSTPTDVTGLSGVTRLSATYSRTCALSGSNRVTCWGDSSPAGRPWEIVGL